LNENVTTVSSGIRERLVNEIDEALFRRLVGAALQIDELGSANVRLARLKNSVEKLYESLNDHLRQRLGHRSFHYVAALLRPTKLS
jgi:hypothetical protein